MTTNPNRTPSPTEVIAASDEARNLYSVDAINEWRSNESLRLGWLRMESFESAANDDQYVTTFKDAIDQKLDEFLATKGIAPDDAEYDALRQLYRDSSIDRFSENEWGNSPASRGVDANDAQSQSEKTRELIRQWHDAQVDDTEVADDDERTIDIIRTELNEARELWSGMQAKRQGRLWDRRIKGYNATKERYERLNRELGSRTLEDTINDDTLSDAEKNAAVIAYIFEEQNNLRADTKEHVKNTKISKFVDKFGGWLNKGNGWTKFGKGALVGLGAGLVGAGAGLLFGAAGAGAAVVGAGALVTKSALRFTKAYAKSDARYGRGMEQNGDELKGEWVNELENVAGGGVIEQAVSLSGKKFEDDTKKEQGKRRKTTIVAMGGIAAGATVGVVVGLLLDHFQVSDFVHDKITDKVGQGEPDGAGGAPEDGGGVGNGRADSGGEGNDDGIGDKTMDTEGPSDANSDNGGSWTMPNEQFYVDSGHGYSHELVELAGANGQELSSTDAWRLHLHLVETFGPDYINIAMRD